MNIGPVSSKYSSCCGEPNEIWLADGFKTETPYRLYPHNARLLEVHQNQVLAKTRTVPPRTFTIGSHRWIHLEPLLASSSPSRLVVHRATWLQPLYRPKPCAPSELGGFLALRWQDS
jgi:hypothetical protein